MSNLSVGENKDEGVKTKTLAGWLEIKILYPSGATYLSPDYCFSDHKNPSKHVALAQSGHHHHIIEV